MHELSIAEALWDRVRTLVPAGAVLRGVTVRAGPMRGIDPDIMRVAWNTLIGPTAAVTLDVELSPWHLRCPDCGGEFNADDVMTACSRCGGTRACPVDGDELRLVSLTVDDP